MIKVQGWDAGRRRGEIGAGVSQLTQAQTHGSEERLREAAPLKSREDSHPMDATATPFGSLFTPPSRSRPDWGARCRRQETDALLVRRPLGAEGLEEEVGGNVVEMVGGGLDLQPGRFGASLIPAEGEALGQAILRYVCERGALHDHFCILLDEAHKRAEHSPDGWGCPSLWQPLPQWREKIKNPERLHCATRLTC